jgi:hypothetical protein
VRAFYVPLALPYYRHALPCWLARILQNDWQVNCLIMVNLPLYIRRRSMVPGLIMWLLGVPLVVIVLLFLFHVI